MNSFFSELKRRNVYKVAVAYAVVGWLLIQIATQTFPFFDVPNWAIRLVIVLLVLGLPVAIVLAWAFELTPAGLKRTQTIGSDARRKPRPVLEPDRHSVPSLAVLPLVNESANPEMEYLSEGIAEGIINRLSQLSSWRVLARNTVFRYKNGDPQEVGALLQVDSVFAGTLSQRGEQLLIKAELIVMADGSQAWGGRFAIDPSQISSAEELISKEIADKLQMRLTEQQQGRAQKQNTQNAEAYRLYLRGRYQWDKRTNAGLHKAIEYFKEAIEIEPDYAQAWAGLADSYTILGCWGYEPPHQCYPKARAAAARALELDETLSEAHASLGATKKDYDWDWNGAEAEYKRALELNPGNAMARQWYAEYLGCLGRHAESIAECERAQALDPLSPIVAATLGRHGYCFAREYDRGISELKKVVRSDPEFYVAHVFLGFAYVYNAQLPEALAAFTKAQALDDNADAVAGLGYALALSKRDSEARKILQQLKELREERYVQPVVIALVHVGLGESDEAFSWLEKAYEEHAQWLSEIKVDPAFDTLRSDARFKDLLKRMRLGECGSDK